MISEINSQNDAAIGLSEKDRHILTILQNDGRVSNQELAEKVGMSKSACWRRVRVLEEAGLIEGYTARLNPEACGLGFHAIVHVMLARHQMNHLKQFTDASDSIAGHYETREFGRAIREIMALADLANQYIDENKPWLLAKEAGREQEVQDVCSMGLNLFRILVVYLKPVLPAVAASAEILMVKVQEHCRGSEAVARSLCLYVLNCFDPVGVGGSPQLPPSQSKL